MNKTASGFTLVELLVVITIMAIVGAYSLSNLGFFGEDQKLKSATQDIQSLIKTAQANATTNTKCDTQFGTWQVKFENATTVKLECLESGNATAFIKKTISLATDISLQSVIGTGTGCPSVPPPSFVITFEQLSGKMNFGNSGCATLTFALRNSRISSNNIQSFSTGTGGASFIRPSCDISGSQLNGLVGYWDFNEGSGTTVADKSGFGRTGAWNTAGWDPNGKIGSAGQFSGSNYVSLGTNALGSMSGPFTISAWIKTSSTANQAVISEYEGNTCGDALFYIAPSSHEIGFHDGGSYVSNSINPGINLADNQWHHIAYVYTVTDGKIYLEGSERATNRYTPSSGIMVLSPGGTSWQNSCTAQQVRIGATSIRNTTTNLVTNERLFNGSIDEVRIYNRALTPAEITASYNGNAGCSLF